MCIAVHIMSISSCSKSDFRSESTEKGVNWVSRGAIRRGQSYQLCEFLLTTTRFVEAELSPSCAHSQLTMRRWRLISCTLVRRLLVMFRSLVFSSTIRERGGREGGRGRLGTRLQKCPQYWPCICSVETAESERLPPYLCVSSVHFELEPVARSDTLRSMGSYL